MTEFSEEKVKQVQWERFTAKRTQQMQSSAIRELLKITQQPEIISFAGGLPAPELFPVDAIISACSYLLAEEPQKALQYSTTEGHLPLREYLAKSLSTGEAKFTSDNVLVTTGSQQALDLIGKVFIDPGAKVLTGNPTYLGAIQAWRAYEAEFVTIVLDADGMMVEKLEDVVKNTPVRFIYVLPNFHNPAGTTLTLERRHHLVEIARKYDLLIVEDDPYGALRYEGPDLPPIAVLAPERTLYLGTFSKTLTPGLRIGWVVGPADIQARLVQTKQGVDLHTSTLDQMIANHIVQSGVLPDHIKKLQKTYGERRDTMIDAMTEFWPMTCTFTQPQGGLFLWACLPDDIDAVEMLKTALKNKVAYVPGINFYPHSDGGYHTMRLNFSNAQPEMIVEGIRRLGNVIKDALK